MRRIGAMLVVMALLAACGAEREVRFGRGGGGRVVAPTMPSAPGGAGEGNDTEDAGETESPGAPMPNNPGIAPGEPHPDAPSCPECVASEQPREDPDAAKPDEPVVGSPEPARDDPGSGPYTEARPGQEDVHARPWESAAVHDDDVTVDLTYWSGPEPCSVLDHVDVHEAPDAVTITLFEGHEPGFDGACPSIAVQRRTQVRFVAPLAGRSLVDGADTS